MELVNQTVLVTGSAGNLGSYVTTALLDEGAEVVGTYLTESDRNEAETRVEIPDADFPEWTAPGAVVDEIINLLSNADIRGQVVWMTGGQLAVSA